MSSTSQYDTKLKSACTVALASAFVIVFTVGCSTKNYVRSQTARIIQQTNDLGYMLELTGGTDSVGDANYNYQLSQRRADAVANYLQSKYNIPPHKFYLVGIGKDQQVASDSTAAGRAKNRRVDIKLLSNMSDQKSTTASNGPNGQQ